MHLTIRFGVLWQFVCVMFGHRWEQYMAISAWHSRGRFCKRCGKSVLLRNDHIKTMETGETHTYEAPEPWLKAEVS